LSWKSVQASLGAEAQRKLAKTGRRKRIALLIVHFLFLNFSASLWSGVE
jgi:hypothetical protein